MPRFFFDLRLSGERLERDDVGIELADFEAAYLEAHRAAIDIWADARRQGHRPDHAAFEVRGECGAVVLELPFTEALGLSRPPPQSRHAETNRLVVLAIKADLDRAEETLVRDDQYIADQQARVQRLEQSGYDATLAKTILATFVQTQALRQRYRNQLRRYLR